MVKNSQKFGNEAEGMARAYLVKQGYEILETNWRHGKYEVDLIARHENVIIFCEVKGRSSVSHGEPESFVGKSKQKFIIAAANAYMLERQPDKEARFDIVTVIPDKANFIVNHLPGAFYPGLK